MGEAYCEDCEFDNASILREFMAAHKWSNTTAAAVWGVSAQTVCNWRRTGRYPDGVYRQMYESDWGQQRFNPEWPDKFWRCGIGYSDAEKAEMGLSPWDMT